MCVSMVTGVIEPGLEAPSSVIVPDLLKVERTQTFFTNTPAIDSPTTMYKIREERKKRKRESREREQRGRVES